MEEHITTYRQIHTMLLYINVLLDFPSKLELAKVSKLAGSNNSK